MSFWGIQEARRVQADLDTLPRSHEYACTLGQDRMPVASTDGEALLASERELVAMASQLYARVHARGRALAWSLMTLFGRTSRLFTSTSLPPRQRDGLLSHTASFVTRVGGRSAVVRDWSFVLSGEARLQGSYKTI